MTKRSEASWLPAYAAFVLACMVLVILEGAVVRATGSGGGCGNHWPLCNGNYFPHHPRLATIIEYTHRSMTGVLTALAAALIAWVFVAQPKGARTRRAAVWVGILLVTEALLGAILVKGGYVEHNTSNARVIVQGIHFTNTMLLVAALTLTWWWLRPAEEVSVSPGGRVTMWLALAATLLVGATGSVAALADTLFPSPTLRIGLLQDFSNTAPLLIRMRWMHPAFAVLSAGFILWLCLRVRGRMVKWVFCLLILQMALGVTDVLLLAPTWMQVVHLLGADIYWIALVALAADVLWPSIKTSD
jgi:cytochrome c oxidase assembly protein subunit 15